MRSTFFGFDIARRALQSQQRALDITGHNIANAATPGYSRQRAVLTATKPYTIPSMHSPHTSGQIGTGVEVSAVYRLRDGFTDYQFRSQNQTLGKGEAEWQTLERVEGIFAEPAAAGLKTAMGEFFNAWQDLSRDGADETVRAIVRQRGAAVADMFRHIDGQLQDVVDDVNHGLELAVNEINSLASQIASLNDQIQSSELGGYQANDLRDKRDLLVDELSKLVNINVFEDKGYFAVVVNGVSLVRHESVTRMKLSDTPNLDGVHTVKWEDSLGNDGMDVSPHSGRLAGLEGSRDKVKSYMAELDKLAAAFAAEMISLHAQGRDLNGDLGVAFFHTAAQNTAQANGDPVPVDTVTARNIAVNEAMMDPDTGLNLIAASGEPFVEGDGSNALKIAGLRDDKIGSLQNASLEQYFEGILGTLGVDGQHSKRLVENQAHLVEQLEMRRASISGVSLDEEMANMIQFQHAYNAAARLVTTMDEVLDVLINRTGLR